MRRRQLICRASPCVRALLLGAAICLLSVGLGLWLVTSSAAEDARPAASPLADIYNWFALAELPFLFLTVLFGFLTAAVLKGGRFGEGMVLIAWGSLVMGIGHIHMQIYNLLGTNLLDSLFGKTGGGILWFVALICAWALSGTGFYYIYSASKGG